MLKGFGTYHQEISLDLSGKKVIGIVGPNESGKSTILRAICYAAYGKVPLKQDVHKVRSEHFINAQSDGPMVVEATFDLGHSSITIQRTRTKGGTGRISIDGTALKAADAQTELDSVIRLSYSDFISLAYFAQGDIDQFMLGDKGAYFKRWTQPLALWQKLSDRFSSQAALLEGRRVKTAAEREQWAQRAISVADGRRARSVAFERKSKLIARVERLQNAVIELTARLKAEGAAGSVRSQLSELRASMRAVEARNSEATSNLERLSKEVNQIKRGVCPILGIKCNPLERSGTKKKSAVASQMARIKKQLNGNHKELRRLQAAEKKLIERSAENDSDRFRYELSARKKELVLASQELENASMKLAKIEAACELAKQARRRVQKCRKEESRLEASMGQMQFLKHMCSSAGIPAEIMTGELAAMEDRCNWILERLDYQKRICLTAFSELGGYEPTCQACGSDKWTKKHCQSCGGEQQHKRKYEPAVSVIDGATEMPFALESGGGQVLQSFAARLAGALFVASMLGVGFEMVMLDEIFAHLDADNRQKLMGLVIGRLGSEFGLRQQLVVSHHEDIINSVDSMILVSKGHGGSVARWS
jgi:DNA repair exonuclease SbcCD ATPase subunit